MLHFNHTTTQLVERDYILLALKDLGYAYRVQTECETLRVRGAGGYYIRVEIKIATRNPDYAIGLRRVGQSYQVVADWWGVRFITRQEFLRRLTQRYAYHAALASLQEQGFSVVREEMNPYGEVHFLVQKEDEYEPEDQPELCLSRHHGS
jgi:hypothetical protein